MADEQRLRDRVVEEIERLHRFFVDWFAGTIADDDDTFNRMFLDALDPGFVLIPPAGRIVARSDLASGLRSGHGSNPDFRIAIRNVEIRRAVDGVVLATYEEWQRNARASKPPDNGRISTVLFQGEDLRWLHLHETWLPESVMAAGPFDF